MERAELRVGLAMVVVLIGGGGWVVEAQSWCVAISTASDEALQAALNYACGAGANCSPIQANGLCYEPNTLQNHSSYAFNSYYQNMDEATGSCDFDGTATITTINPSYGSCVYPSSPSAAGGTSPTTTPTPTTPTTTTPTTTPPSTTSPTYGLGPSTTDINRATFRPSITFVLPSSLLLVLSLVFLPMQPMFKGGIL